MGRFAEEVGCFRECSHGGGKLRRSGQDDAEQFFRRAAIGGLAFPPAIKGLRPTEYVFFGEIAGSSRANRSAGRESSEPKDRDGSVVLLRKKT